MTLVWAIARCIRRGNFRPVGEIIAAALALAWHRVGGRVARIEIEYGLKRAGVRASGYAKIITIWLRMMTDLAVFRARALAIRIRGKAAVAAIHVKHWLRCRA